MKARKTKIHLVQVLDDQGNTLAHKYIFGDKEKVEQIKQKIKEEALHNEYSHR